VKSILFTVLLSLAPPDEISDAEQLLKVVS